MEKEKRRQEEMMQEEMMQEEMMQERYKSDGTALEDGYEQREMMPGEGSEADGTPPEETQEPGSHAVSETWAEETIADLDDFIESQGIYIRQ